MNHQLLHHFQLTVICWHLEFVFLVLDLVPPHNTSDITVAPWAAIRALCSSCTGSSVPLFCSVFIIFVNRRSEPSWNTNRFLDIIYRLDVPPNLMCLEYSYSLYRAVAPPRGQGAALRQIICIALEPAAVASTYPHS